MSYLKGLVEFQSDLDIIEVANVLSKKIFSDIQFIGLEESIYEEIPAVYLKGNLLGLRIILSGYSGFSEDDSFLLEIQPDDPEYYMSSKDINIQSYLELLFEKQLNFKVKK